jgi:tRNA nucleotidyltransferase (CCA-adding enzyme)
VSDDLLERLPEAERALLLRCGELAVARREHAFLVGGSVRDLLLGRAQSDLDVVVVGDGMAVAQALARDRGGTLTRHHAFQTARIDVPGGTRVDVATARREVYPRPGQLPQVVPGTLEEDLQRRDFTINAMAISLAPDDAGRFVDPEGGTADLEAGRIQVMHRLSFSDDPTRILRALRFALRFGYTIEPQSLEWLRVATAGGYLDSVSGERLRKELSLTFEENPIEGPLRLQDEGVLAMYDGLAADPDRLRRLTSLRSWHLEVLAGRGLSPAADPAWPAVLACCAAALSPQARWGLARRLSLSRDERAPLIEAGAPWRRAVAGLEDAGEEAPPSAIVAALEGISPAALLVAAASAGEGSAAQSWITRYLETLQWIRPRLTGDDLRRLGVQEGPALGALLARLRAAVVDGRVEGEQEERRLVERILGEKPHG